jgi:signal transduction histidine kinase
MGRGLVVRKGDQFVATRQADGLPSDEVGGIIGVGPYLWLATTGGIARVKRDELYDRSATSGPLSECLVFGPDDGLLDFACSSSYSPNMHRAKDGRLWISMVENVVSIDPEEVSKKAKLPQIYIEEVRVNDEVIESSNDTLQIPPGPSRLSFTYTAVMLEAPERTRFQYRLEGLDATWVDSWGQRTASYNSPPPGAYQFHVRASDSRGEWDDHAATIRVTIEPHFWQMLSFKIASIALFGTVFGAIVWLAARIKLSRKLVVLERDHAVEKERARIASEIHDQLGAQLTQILFQSQSLTGRLENEEDKQAANQASKVNSSAQELARGLDEVVWATNPEMDNLEGLVAYISSYAEEFFRHTPVRLRFDVPISLDTREMASEVRHNLFLAACEAMTNLLKHAEASEATIRTRSITDDFVIEISDDGRGLAPESSRRLGNGLRNMNERMQRIGGAAAFIPRQSGGLVVRLSVAIPSTLESVSPKKGIHSENRAELG